MTRFGIVLADKPDRQVFAEHVEAVCWGLSELGHEVEVITYPRQDVRNIVVGPQLLLAVDEHVRLPPGSIVWNAEPQVSPLFVRSLRLLGQPDVVVWDYARRTTEFLRSCGVPARTVPFPWAPTMARHLMSASGQRDLLKPAVDVLFVGSLNERRLPFLQALVKARVVDGYSDGGGLTERPLRVQILSGGVYGRQRDEWLLRSRLCLNLHFWHDAPNEDARIIMACANGVAVVSEGNPDEPHKEAWACWTGSSSVEDLVDVVETWLNSGRWREQGPRGAEAMRAIAADSVLREALKES